MLNFSEDCMVTQYLDWIWNFEISSSTNMNLVKKEYFFME